MLVKIETYSDYEYDPIKKEYGSVLNKYGLQEIDDKYGRNNFKAAAITLNTIEELFQLDADLRKLDEDEDGWHLYFGLMTQIDENCNNRIVIKDNYD